MAGSDPLSQERSIAVPSVDVCSLSVRSMESILPLTPPPPPSSSIRCVTCAAMMLLTLIRNGRSSRKMQQLKTNKPSTNCEPNRQRRRWLHRKANLSPLYVHPNTVSDGLSAKAKFWLLAACCMWCIPPSLDVEVMHILYTTGASGKLFAPRVCT